MDIDLTKPMSFHLSHINNSESRLTICNLYVKMTVYLIFQNIYFFQKRFSFCLSALRFNKAMQNKINI